jgi:hypothetical protein
MDAVQISRESHCWINGCKQKAADKLLLWNGDAINICAHHRDRLIGDPDPDVIRVKIMP